MIIRGISLYNVRSYELFSTDLDPNVTLILGNNGTGKTSLLEGIYFLMQGTSFRGRDRDMINHTSTRAEILLSTDDDKRRGIIQLSTDDKIKKSFVIKDKTSLRLPMKYRCPVVLFEPDELRLINSSPQRRRNFFDSILSRLYPQYSKVLNRYQRVLAQRNDLLKKYEFTNDKKAWSDHLFAWDFSFVELASTIVNMREQFVVTSNQHMSKFYSKLANEDYHITVSYNSSVPGNNYQQSLLKRLHENQNRDAMLGYTCAGPHRDDFTIMLNGHPANEVASRGEMRTIMLAYKLLEVELQHEIYGSAPLILMDDVFSELDATREQQLITALQNYQTIITATDLRDSLKSHAKIINL